MSEIKPEIYRKVILAILKKSSNEITVKELYDACLIPSETVDRVLKTLQREEALYVQDQEIRVGVEQKIKLALKAVEKGADIERVCRFIDWKEFERVVTLAFTLNGYEVRRGFRFSWDGRRWEIDVLAVKRQVIVSADCKHWRRGLGRSSVARIVEKQVQRTKVFTEALEKLRGKLGLQDVSKIIAVPLIISLYPPPMKLYDSVPIIPILQLASFISDLPANLHSLKLFRSRLT
ncbi:hypothetical protein J7L06_09840 [Candidatus Bathyarchaeota archaeon]|nr:hypothetical protein [Candidatus Bathyarchaeota archaeon]